MTVNLNGYCENYGTLELEKSTYDLKFHKSYCEKLYPLYNTHNNEQSNKEMTKIFYSYSF